MSVVRPALVLLGLAAACVLGWWALAVPGGRDPMGVAARAAFRSVDETYNRWRTGSGPDYRAAAKEIPGADVRRGRTLVRTSGCGTCHAIPGLPGARGTVGPSLEGFSRRAYIAGILPNRPGDLVSWLMNPPRHAPDTAMPALGLIEDDARDMAAWLYTLDGIE